MVRKGEEQEKELWESFVLYLPPSISDLESGNGLASDFTRANGKLVFVLDTHGFTRTWRHRE